MADPVVKRVWLPNKGVRGGLDISSGLAAQFTLLFQVEYDRAHGNVPLLYTADAAGAAEGYDLKIPPAGDVIGAYVLLGITLERQDDPRFWTVACTYKIPEPGQGVRPPDPDVPHWNVDIQINPIPYEFENQKDKNGKMIVNTVGDPIGGVMTQRYMEEIVIGFNCVEPNWIGLDAAYGTRGDGTVNSEDFSLIIHGSERVFPAGMVHWENYALGATRDPDGSINPRMTYRMRWRPDGWVRKLANKGFNELFAGDPSPIYVPGTRTKIAMPVYLKTVDLSDVVRAAVTDPVEFVDADLYDTYDLGAELIFDMET